MLVGLSVIIAIYIGLNILNGTNRAIIVGFGMLIPLVTYYIFKRTTIICILQ